MKTDALFAVVKPSWGCQDAWVESTHKIYPFHTLCILDYIFEDADLCCEHCGNSMPSFDGGTQFGRMWVLVNWRSAKDIQVVGECCLSEVPKMGMKHADQVHGQSRAVVMPERFVKSLAHQAVMHQFLRCDKKYLGSAFPSGIKSLKDLKASFTQLGGYAGPGLTYNQDGNRFVVYGGSFDVVVAKLTEGQVVDLLNDILRNQITHFIPSGTQLSLFP